MVSHDTSMLNCFPPVAIRNTASGECLTLLECKTLPSIYIGLISKMAAYVVSLGTYDYLVKLFLG